MTPAIETLRKAKLDFNAHEYRHDAAARSYGVEAASKLGIAEQRVFKTLVVRLSQSGLAVGVIPVASTLDMKRFAKALGVKKASMAEAAEVERSTGYVLGGVSPLGQKKRLPTLVDRSALEQSTIFVSAGRRGLEIELAPRDLVALTGAILLCCAPDKFPGDDRKNCMLLVPKKMG